MANPDEKDGSGSDSADGAVRPPTFIAPSDRPAYDTRVTLEEYMFYAKQTREEEKRELPNPEKSQGFLDQVFRRKSVDAGTVLSGTDSPPVNGKSGSITSSPEGRAQISADEWRNASRLMRTASWGAGFYLITTDILGPYGVGFAIGTLGWGPGIVLYTIFAALAGYCGFLLWKLYLGLDSYEFPLRNYGDLAFRIYGSIARHCVNVLQSLQLLLICGQVIIQNGQGISQASKFRLCYVVCILIFVIVGFLVGQVRTLRNYGLASAVAVGLNLMVIFITMGVMANSPPNYAISVLGSAGSANDDGSITPNAQGDYPPIIHYNGLPNPDSLLGSVNGLMQGVFAFGGAQIFVEVMAEMRRPFDFIKAMCIAQFFIWSVYLIYGCYTYYWQGQYAFQVSYLGLSVYGFSVACNMMAVIAGLVAAGLYSNIGIKVLYNNILMDLFKAPPLTTRGGKICFAILVPIYWVTAFVIAAAIPDYFGFVSIIAAFCVVQFSYSFPPILFLGYLMQKSAIRAGMNEGFDPATGETKRLDKGIKRWVRGFYADKWYVNVWHVILGGGALAVAGLGAYAAIQSMILAFEVREIQSHQVLNLDRADLNTESSNHLVHVHQPAELEPIGAVMVFVREGS